MYYINTNTQRVFAGEDPAALGVPQRQLDFYPNFGKLPPK
jgi:hypothetical protein